VSDKTKKRLLEKLPTGQTMLEGKETARERMIRTFQMLIANGGLFSQIIDFFPYPIVIYTPQYTLALANNAFVAETRTRLRKSEKRAVRILQHRIGDPQLAASVRQVFAGATFFLSDLSEPFSMFSGLTRQSKAQLDRFSKAVIFPVPADDAEITHGVIVFMP
jgi:hypothetical protein